MSAPERSKAEYWIMALAGLLILGLGVGISVAKFIGPFPVESPSPSAATTPLKSAAASTPTPDPTAGWPAYADSADKFSLHYPTDWQKRTCKVGAHTTLYLAPTAAGLGACNSDFGGMMYLGAMDGDQRASLKWTTGYSDLTTQNLVVSGAAGIRQSATVTESAGLGPEPGSKLAQYIFYANARTYVASYTQGPAAASALADFDRMVKSTLVFTP